MWYNSTLDSKVGGGGVSPERGERFGSNSCDMMIVDYSRVITENKTSDMESQFTHHGMNEVLHNTQVQ